MEVSLVSPVVKTLSRAAGKLVSTLRLSTTIAYLGSLVISSVAVLLSVTLPAGRDTHTVTTPGRAGILTTSTVCSLGLALPQVSTTACEGGGRRIIRGTVFLIAVISRQTIILTITHPAGGDTVTVLTAEPTL